MEHKKRPGRPTTGMKGIYVKLRGSLVEPLGKVSNRNGFINDAIQFKLKDDLFEFSNIPKWRDIIVHIANNAAKQRAGKGYIINGIRSEIRKYHGNKVINHQLIVEGKNNADNLMIVGIIFFTSKVHHLQIFFGLHR